MIGKVAVVPSSAGAYRWMRRAATSIVVGPGIDTMQVLVVGQTALSMVLPFPDSP
jgi:hypothetical protein